MQQLLSRKHTPTRMCVCCRVRFDQPELIRLQYLHNTLTSFTKHGRSFYLCKGCLTEKNLQKKISQTLKISYEKASELINHIDIGVK